MLFRSSAPTLEAFEQAATAAFVNAKTYEHNAFKVELGQRAIVRALSTAAQEA